MRKADKPKTPAEQTALDNYLDTTRDDLIDAILDHGLRDIPDPDTLTPRQTEIVQHWAQGQTNPEVAEDLDISVSTVGSHAEAIHQRLNTKTQAHAVAIALERDLLG